MGRKQSRVRTGDGHNGTKEITTYSIDLTIPEAIPPRNHSAPEPQRRVVMPESINQQREQFSTSSNKQPNDPDIDLRVDLRKEGTLWGTNLVREEHFIIGHDVPFTATQLLTLRAADSIEFPSELPATRRAPLCIMGDFAVISGKHSYQNMRGYEINLIACDQAGIDFAKKTAGKQNLVLVKNGINPTEIEAASYQSIVGAPKPHYTSNADRKLYLKADNDNDIDLNAYSQTVAYDFMFAADVVATDPSLAVTDVLSFTFSTYRHNTYYGLYQKQKEQIANALLDGLYRGLVTYFQKEQGSDAYVHPNAGKFRRFILPEFEGVPQNHKTITAIKKLCAEHNCTCYFTNDAVTPLRIKGTNTFAVEAVAGSLKHLGFAQGSKTFNPVYLYNAPTEVVLPVTQPQKRSPDDISIEIDITRFPTKQQQYEELQQRFSAQSAHPEKIAVALQALLDDPHHPLRKPRYVWPFKTDEDNTLHFTKLIRYVATLAPNSEEVALVIGAYLKDHPTALSKHDGDKKIETLPRFRREGGTLYRVEGNSQTPYYYVDGKRVNGVERMYQDLNTIFSHRATCKQDYINNFKNYFNNNDLQNDAIKKELFNFYQGFITDKNNMLREEKPFFLGFCWGNVDSNWTRSSIEILNFIDKKLGNENGGANYGHYINAKGTANIGINNPTVANSTQVPQEELSDLAQAKGVYVNSNKYKLSGG